MSSARSIEKNTIILKIQEIGESLLDPTQEETYYTELDKLFNAFSHIGMNALDKESNHTPLMVAASLRNLYAINWLIKRAPTLKYFTTPSPAIDYQNSKKESALSLAVKFKDLNIPSEDKRTLNRRAAVTQIFNSTTTNAIKCNSFIEANKAGNLWYMEFYLDTALTNEPLLKETFHVKPNSSLFDIIHSSISLGEEFRKFWIKYFTKVIEQLLKTIKFVDFFATLNATDKNLLGLFAKVDCPELLAQFIHINDQHQSELATEQHLGQPALNYLEAKYDKNFLAVILSGEVSPRCVNVLTQGFRGQDPIAIGDVFVRLFLALHETSEEVIRFFLAFFTDNTIHPIIPIDSNNSVAFATRLAALKTASLQLMLAFFTSQHIFPAFEKVKPKDLFIQAGSQEVLLNFQSNLYAHYIEYITDKCLDPSDPMKHVVKQVLALNLNECIPYLQKSFDECVQWASIDTLKVLLSSGKIIYNIDAQTGFLAGVSFNEKTQISAEKKLRVKNYFYALYCLQNIDKTADVKDALLKVNKLDREELNDYINSLNLAHHQQDVVKDTYASLNPPTQSSSSAVSCDSSLQAAGGIAFFANAPKSLASSMLDLSCDNFMAQVKLLFQHATPTDREVLINRLATFQNELVNFQKASVDAPVASPALTR